MIRKSSAREMDVKSMEKEITEGKRICIGVIGSDLDESLPLRKVLNRWMLLMIDDSKIG